MIKILTNMINEESFVENSITKHSINLDQKEFIIETNGGQLNSGEFLNKSKIIINDWSKLEIFQRVGNEVKLLLNLPAKFLTSIIEFHCSNNELRLTGLGYDCWIDWVFTNPKIEIYGEYDDDSLIPQH